MASVEVTFNSDEDRISFREFFTPNCSECGCLKEYSEKYDSYFCFDCDIWGSSKCDDEDCEFCVNRPDKPSDVDNE